MLKKMVPPLEKKPPLKYIRLVNACELINKVTFLNERRSFRWGKRVKAISFP
jgi:hypothetical protein